MQSRWLAMVVAWTTVFGSGAVLEADVPRKAEAPGPAAGAIVEGSSFVIEPPAAPFVRDLDERERREQIRDWAVLGTVARLGADPRQAAAATYELPPARLPYLDELYSFEYGRGRRAYLGDRVLLFRDASDPDPIATIGRLADRVRMENGELPPAVEVYVVRDNRDDGVIAVERAPDVSRDELFSPAYGYVEGSASTPEALAEWLSQADDLTSVKIAGDRIALGGRWFAHTRTPNLTVEDVAALYQAHEQLNGPRIAAQAKLRKLPPRAQAALAHIIELGKAHRDSQQAAAPDLEQLIGGISIEQLPGFLDAASDAASPARAPGFSLDPTWLPLSGDPRHPQLLAALRAFASDPCGEMRAIAEKSRSLVEQESDESRRTELGVMSVDAQHAGFVSDAICDEIKRTLSPKLLQVAAEIERAAPADWDKALTAYYTLREDWLSRSGDDLRAKAAGIAGELLEFREAESKVQCARYEGTAGTQVGMTLFYTDLIAKLWESTDFGMSAPVLEVPGFLSAPQLDLPAAFRLQVERNPGTRLWFGPRANHVSRVNEMGGVRFAFEHRYSRIYAASNNETRPGVEVQPREDSRRTIGWWNRHFDDVADYEPQFHRQNQIMKWSLIAAALVESPVAAYLRSTDVDSHATFATWQQAKARELRFGEALPAVRVAIPGRECIPILASYPFHTLGTEKYVAGGVTAAGLDAPKAAPKPNLARPLGSRKPYFAETGGAANRTATRAHPEVARNKVSFENAERAPMNDLNGPVNLGVPTVDYGPGKAPGELVIRAGQGKGTIGDLSTSIDRGIVRQRWTNGAVERGRHGEPAPLKTIASADAAARDGHAYAAADAYERMIKNAATPDDIARLALVDASRGRATALVDKLKALEAQRGSLTPGGRQAVRAAVDELASPAAARRARAMIERGAPLDDASGAVRAVDGRAVVVRDIEPSMVAKAQPIQASDLSDGKVYVDGQVRAAHDGLHADTGAYASRWRKVRNVKMSDLDASAFGAAPDRPADLPDVLRLPDGRTFEAPAPPPGEHARRSPAMPHRHIRLIEQCDGDHRTKTTSDDCPEAR
jgi:hypothetical protein